MTAAAGLRLAEQSNLHNSGDFAIILVVFLRLTLCATLPEHSLFVFLLDFAGFGSAAAYRFDCRQFCHRWIGWTWFHWVRAGSTDS